MRKKIWIHAVSVGEVNAALDLIRRLVSNNYRVFLSTTTVTGQQVARSAAGTSVTLLYFPFDFKLVCRAFLRKINPDVIALMETEIWPNFLEVAMRERIPVIFINGRISDNSFKNYLRISSLIKPLFNRITFMCMQSDTDAARIREIGAPEKILRVTGNMKFDYSLEIPAEKRRLQNQVGSLLLPGRGSQLWICGSTKPNEEELISSIYINLKEEFPGLSLLIAPRHPHRGEEVEEIFRSSGFSTRRRSLIDLNATALNKGCDVLVLDSVGELAYLYEIADLVFMGGSLVPTGGQNVIEPAFFGKPILFGPSMTNFREIAEIFTSRKAAVQVQSLQELEIQVRKLLPDEAERLALGENARQVLENNRGAVERNLEIIKLID
ncbi:MAG: 3-deoxy-D-manno-octulosonic acid transferase [Acidobacteriota bacterium]